MSPEQRSRTRIPLGGGSSVTTCPGEGSTQPKQPGAPGPPTGSRTPIHYPDPSAGREQTPRLRGSGAAMCPQVRERARLPSFLRKTCSPTTFSVGCQTVLLVARYQGAQYSRWRHARQSATPVRHGNSAMEFHNAYAVDPTVYAATYTASTGASPMGQEKTLLGQSLQDDEVYPARDSPSL